MRLKTLKGIRVKLLKSKILPTSIKGKVVGLPTSKTTQHAAKKKAAEIAKHYETYFHPLVALSDEDVESVYHLRHDVYCEELGFEPVNPQKVERDEFDDYSDYCLVRHKVLKYLEEVPAEESRWEGECFVFDGRVSVGHGLEEGTYDLCHACRRPISDEDKTQPAYEEGVCCPRCVDEYDEDDRVRFRERQKQIKLAKARGKIHIGTP